MLSQQPYRIPAFFGWLLRGRSYCKRRLAALTPMPISTLSVDEDILSMVRLAKHQGRATVLATATDFAIAQSVADQLGCFDAVLASGTETNLKGGVKQRAIRSWCNAHDVDGYTYAGDSFADIPVWQDAQDLVVARPSGRLLKAVERLGKPMAVVGERTHTVWLTAKAIRPHQWIKNLLVFVPMLLNQRVDTTRLAAAMLAFTAFSFAASAVYIFNDLSDISADRQHPKKTRRPFSSGQLSVPYGVILLGVLAMLALAIALTLPQAVTVVISVYFLANYAYSTWLKQKPLLDIMMLAGMYCARLQAGASATYVTPSPWLMAFAMFFFTSLAAAKRFAELARLRKEGAHHSSGRGYLVGDTHVLQSIGLAAGYTAILVLALYMNSEQMHDHYPNGQFLWVVCPFMLYWISRVWLLAQRGRLNEDPVIFALRDRVSWLVAASILILIATSALPIKLHTYGF